MRTFRTREGIFGGVAAGMVMAMVAMLYTLLSVGDLLAPLGQMGAIFVPGGGMTAMLAGMMLHVMTAAILGVLFVALARAAIAGGWGLGAGGYAPLAIAAMGYIVIEWAIAAFVILPAVDRPLLPTFASIGGFVAHAMYGVALAAWLVWRSVPATIQVRAKTHQHPAV